MKVRKYFDFSEIFIIHTFVILQDEVVKATISKGKGRRILGVGHRSFITIKKKLSGSLARLVPT